MTAKVGIVLVSHSELLAAGAVELAAELGGRTVPIAAAGGTDDGGIGTSAAKLETAIHSVDHGSGVVVLPDLGSSVLTAKTLLAGGYQLPEQVAIADAPFVEGAISAAVIASTGADFAAVLAAAEEARGVRKL